MGLTWARHSDANHDGPKIVSTGNSHHYLWESFGAPAPCEGWHLLESAGLSVIEERIGPGGAERSHYHVHATQFLYVLQGRACVATEHGTFELQKQEGFTVPPRVTHRVSNPDPSTDVLLLVVSSPKAHGDRVNTPDDVYPVTHPR